MRLFLFSCLVCVRGLLYSQESEVSGSVLLVVGRDTMQMFVEYAQYQALNDHQGVRVFRVQDGLAATSGIKSAREDLFLVPRQLVAQKGKDTILFQFPSKGKVYLDGAELKVNEDSIYNFIFNEGQWMSESPNTYLYENLNTTNGIARKGQVLSIVRHFAKQKVFRWPNLLKRRSASRVVNRLGVEYMEVLYYKDNLLVKSFLLSLFNPGCSLMSFYSYEKGRLVGITEYALRKIPYKWYRQIPRYVMKEIKYLVGDGWEVYW